MIVIVGVIATLSQCTVDVELEPRLMDSGSFLSDGRTDDASPAADASFQDADVADAEVSDAMFQDAGL